MILHNFSLSNKKMLLILVINHQRTIKYLSVLYSIFIWRYIFNFSERIFLEIYELRPKFRRNSRRLQHCVTLNPFVKKKHLLLQTMKLYRGWLNVWKNWLTHIRCNEHFVQILMMLMRLWILWSFALSENSIYPIPTLQYFR